MIKSDINTAIDDERRKTGSGFVSTAEITRYENLALQDMSGQIDFYEQGTYNDFSFVPEVRLSAVNALSAVAPSLKTTGAIISIAPLSSTTQVFRRVRPEQFHYLTEGNWFAQSGRDLWVMHDGKSGDTLRVNYVANYVAKTSGATLSASLTAATDEPLNDMDPEAIISFVLYKIFKKEGKKDDAADAKRRYEDIVKTLKRDNEYRRANIYDRMIVE
jgi:hypothetical protein